MEQLYRLMVTLGLNVGGLSAAAGMALRSFAQMETAATRVDRLMAGMRLSLDTRGLSAGASGALRTFAQLEQAPGRLGAAFRGMNLTGGTLPFVQNLQQTEAQIASTEGRLASLSGKIGDLGSQMQVMRAGGMGMADPQYRVAYNQRQNLYGQRSGLATQANALGMEAANARAALQGHLDTQMTAVQEATAAHQKAINAGTGMVTAGAVLTGVGLAGAAALRDWVSAAREVQDAMANVGLATRGTQGDLQRIQQMSYTVAGQTQFSAPDVLKMAQLAATGGINDRRTLATMLPTLARGAEIENRLKGISYETSVPAMVAIAHQFQAYGAQPGMTPAQGQQANTRFQSLIGRVVQAQTVSNLSPTQLERSLAYLTSAHAGLGVTPEQAIEFTAFASNVGLTGGQGGGARLRSFFQRLAGPGRGISNAWSRSLAAIERRGGGTFFDAQGQFEGVQNAFAVISRATQSYGANQKQRLQDFQSAFGAAGGMIATVGSTPEAMARQQQLQQAFAQNPITFTTQAQGGLNATESGQLTTLHTNIHSLASMLGTALLPTVVAITHGLVQMTSGLVTFASQHPHITAMVAVFAAVAAAVALIGGPILMAVGAVGLLTAGFIALDITLAPILIVVGALVAAVVLAGVALANWDTIAKGLGGTFDWLGTKLHDFLKWLGLLHDSRPKALPKQLTVTHGAGGHVAQTGSDVYQGQRLPPGYYKDTTTGQIHKQGTGAGDLSGQWRGQMPARGTHWDPKTHAFVPDAAKGTGNTTINITQHIHPPPGTDTKKVAAEANRLLVNSVKRQLFHGGAGGAALVPARNGL